MQTIKLDLSIKSIVPILYAKQAEVGRKFKVTLTDNGSPYTVPVGAYVSIWFDGPSGEGNYTDIGEQSAITVSGNEITVEMITQMLAKPGNGRICLVINTAAGIQIGTWNIPYFCEDVPGAGSPSAEKYYTAFSDAVSKLKTPVKGEDYYTEADKDEMVQAVIAQLPVYDGGVADVVEEYDGAVTVV